MTYVTEDAVQKLFQDMVNNRGKAVENSELATAVADLYITAYETGSSRYTSRVDAELAASSDARFINAVANNQMYDRFATRDAAVLSTMLEMIKMDLLTLRVGSRDALGAKKYPDPRESWTNTAP